MPSLINTTLSSSLTYLLQDSNGSCSLQSGSNSSSPSFTCTFFGSTSTLLNAPAAIFFLSGLDGDPNTLTFIGSLYATISSFPFQGTVNCNLHVGSSVTKETLSLHVDENKITMSGNFSVFSPLSSSSTTLSLQFRTIESKLFGGSISGVPDLSFTFGDSSNLGNGSLSGSDLSLSLPISSSADIYAPYSGTITMGNTSTLTFVGGRLYENGSTFFGAPLVSSDVTYETGGINIVANLTTSCLFNEVPPLSILLHSFQNYIDTTFFGYVNVSASDSANTYPFYIMMGESGGSTQIACNVTAPMPSVDALSDGFQYFCSVKDSNKDIVFSFITEKLVINFPSNTNTVTTTVGCSLFDSNTSLVFAGTAAVTADQNANTFSFQIESSSYSSNFSIPIQDIASLMIYSSDPSPSNGITACCQAVYGPNTTMCPSYCAEINFASLQVAFPYESFSGSTGFSAGTFYNQGYYYPTTSSFIIGFAFPKFALLREGTIPDYSGVCTFLSDTINVTNGVLDPSSTFYGESITDGAIYYGYDAATNSCYMLITGTLQNTPTINLSTISGSLNLQPITSAVYSSFSGGSVCNSNSCNLSYASYYTNVSQNTGFAGSHPPYNIGTTLNNSLQLSFALPFNIEMPNPYEGFITMIDPSSNNPNAALGFTYDPKTTQATLDPSSSFFYGLSLSNPITNYNRSSDGFNYVATTSTLSENAPPVDSSIQGVISFPMFSNLAPSVFGAGTGTSTGGYTYSFVSDDGTTNCFFLPARSHNFSNVICTLPPLSPTTLSSLSSESPITLTLQAVDGNGNTLFIVTGSNIDTTNLSSAIDASFSLTLGSTNLGTFDGSLTLNSETTTISIIRSVDTNFSTLLPSSATISLVINNETALQVSATPRMSIDYSNWFLNGVALAGATYGSTTYNGGFINNETFSLSFALPYSIVQKEMTGWIQAALSLFVPNPENSSEPISVTYPLATFNIEQGKLITETSTLFGTPLSSNANLVLNYTGSPEWMNYITISGPMTIQPTVYIAPIFGWVYI